MSMINRKLVAGSVLTAVLVSACTWQQPRGPDTIYFNGKVVTVDAGFTVQQAFAVRGERFLAVGNDMAIRNLAEPATRLVDLGGATVIPGLVDSHDHLWNTAKYLHRGVDMVGVTSLVEMQTRLRAAVVRAAPDEVLHTTTGWTIQPLPTRRDLDQVSTEVPVIAIVSRRGVSIFNSAALARLGITKANPQFRGVKVPVDRDGEPTGAPPGYPNTFQMVDALLPPLLPAAQDAMVAKEMQQRNARGITSVRDLALMPDAVTALQRMRRENKLTVRMSLGIEFPDHSNTARHLASSPSPRYDDPWLNIESVSEEPWTPASMPPEPYKALAREYNRMGWRTAPHVNSDGQRGGTADAALDATLEAFEVADRDSPLDGKRWIVEHAPLATPAQMQRMRKLGLVVSVQDAGYRGPPAGQLTPEQLAHHNPIRSYLDQGLIVVGGSDYAGPTVLEHDPSNLFIPFHYYVSRKTDRGDVNTTAERISREQALRMFTVNGAYATFQEKIKGQIAAGMLADFVILNQDVMTVPEERIPDTLPLATFVGGRKVYSAPGTGDPIRK
jgi:predicted amidohydrolase YtcJ